MKTILIPTDFSAVARNAGLYAIEFAKQTGIKRIVLYNAYQTPVNVDPAMPTIQLLDINELKRASEEGLESYKAELQNLCEEDMEIETLSEFNLLADNIEEVCNKVQADLIIMGITGKSKVEEVLIGSNTISVADNARVPLIIVPGSANFSPVNEIIFACDYKKVVETTPVKQIKQLLSRTGAKLHVVHVERNSGPETTFESLMLDTLLHDCNPSYHLLHGENFVEAINSFASEIRADIIITIPKKHGWFESLFRTRHTKKLAFHSHLPLMVIHD